MHDQGFDDGCATAYEPSSGDVTDGYTDQTMDQSVSCWAAVAE